MAKKTKKSEKRKNFLKQKRLNPGRSNNPDNPNRKAPGKEGKNSFYRTKGKIKLLNLYR